MNTGRVVEYELRNSYTVEIVDDVNDRGLSRLIEVFQGSKILLVDDLIATGGTALAACNLIKKVGGEMIECSFIVDLPDVGGRKKLEDAGYKVFYVVEFEGD